MVSISPRRLEEMDILLYCQSAFVAIWLWSLFMSFIFRFINLSFPGPDLTPCAVASCLKQLILRRLWCTQLLLFGGALQWISHLYLS